MASEQYLIIVQATIAHLSQHSLVKHSRVTMREVHGLEDVKESTLHNGDVSGYCWSRPLSRILSPASKQYII